MNQLNLEITAYISDLLMHYNSVVIPNLGAFEWRYFPARLEPVDQQIYPPSYQLVFNSTHQEDTHQRLVHYIAEKKGIDLNTAQTFLVDIRLSMEECLLKKEQIDLGQLGKLKMNKSGQIELLQNESEQFLDPSRGLSVLKAAPILRDKSYLNQVAAAQGSKKTGKRKGLFIFGSAAAFLLLATGISAIWWWPALTQKQETPAISEISIIPAITEQQEQLLELLSAYENNLLEPIAGLEEDDFSEEHEDNSNAFEDTEPIVEHAEEVEDDPIVEPVSEVVEETTVGPNDYIIVIGVFGESSNYERNARLLREAGYEVQLKKLYTGYTRVAAVVTCNSDQELQEKWAAIRQGFTPKAWIAQN